jgi:ABC-type nitrate/sulfonate/bicarbonate transport system substrate-binding protein
MQKMVLAFLIVWSLAAEVQAASAPAKLVIAFAAMNARTAPLWAAQDQGFFAKYGVDAETIFVGGAPILLAAMTSGDIHVGYTGGTAVLGAAVSGSDLKILATLTNRVTYDLVARQGIKTPEELRSKSIGVVSIGGTNWMGTILGLEKLGLDPNRDNINLRVLGDDSVRVQALVAGTIDATALDGVYSRRLHERGFPIIAEFGKLNLPIVSTGVVARKAYIESRPAAVENVLKALLEANGFVLAPANKVTTLKIIQRHLKVGEREAEEGYKDMAIGLERKPLPSLDGLRNAQRLMRLRNPKLETVKVEELVDDRILRRLDDSGFFDRLSVNAGAR